MVSQHGDFIRIEWKQPTLEAVNWLLFDLLELLQRQTETCFPKEHLESYEHDTNFCTLFEFMQVISHRKDL